MQNFMGQGGRYKNEHTWPIFESGTARIKGYNLPEISFYAPPLAFEKTGRVLAAVGVRARRAYKGRVLQDLSAQNAVSFSTWCIL
jgi:hypothetical protein